MDHWQSSPLSGKSMVDSGAHCTEQAAGENRDGTGFYIDTSDTVEMKSYVIVIM